ncbi:MAG: response regulator [Pyrinomonadaceae bacterium]
MSILIAEDNNAQRHYLRELLSREFAAHAPVVEASDGEAAVSLTLENRPALCILDTQMPKVSGVKAARRNCSALSPMLKPVRHRLPTLNLTEPIHRSLEKKSLLPAIHLAGMGFVDAELMIAAQKLYDVDLNGPSHADQQWQSRTDPKFSGEKFSID